MFRYVAFVWNEADSEARAAAQALTERLRAGSSQWSTILETDGLTVLCRDVRATASRPYRLHGDAGVVLGTLFTRNADGTSAPAPAVLGEDATRAIVTTAGRQLFEAYWGRYVAFVRDPAAHTTWILRDPTSTLPCFTARLSESS